MPKSVTLLKAFLASPSDVNAERDIVAKVLTELNREWSEALSLHVELVRWETHAFPAFGLGPQNVISKETEGKYEIFIGLLWSKFGTATSTESSGTLEEFKRAYAQFQEDNNSISLMFYFKNQPLPLNQLDIEQLKQVIDFRKSIGDLGGLYWEFDSSETFESLIRIHLTKVVRQWSNRITSGLVSFTKLSDSAGAQSARAARSQLQTEELGYLDYIEMINTASVSLTEIVGRMSAATQEIGVEISNLAQAAEKIVKSPSIAEARLLSDKAAMALSIYAERINPEIPQFSQTHSELLKLVSEAAALSGEFGTAQDQNEATLNQVKEMQQSLKSTQNQMKVFEQTVSRLPGMTVKMRKAKRAASEALTNLDREFNNARTHGQSIIAAVEDLLF